MVEGVTVAVTGVSESWPESWPGFEVELHEASRANNASIMISAMDFLAFTP